MPRYEKLHNEIVVLQLVWQNARGQHLRLTAAMVLEMIIGLFPPAAIYLLQKSVGIQANHIETLLTQSNVILVLAVYFVYITLTKLSRVLTAYSVADVEYSLRMQFVQALRRKPYQEMTTKMNLQSSNGLTQEISMASGLIPMVYRSFIRAGATIIAFYILSFVVAPHFFLVVLLLTTAVILSVVILRQRVKRIHQALYTRISSLYQLFAEWIGGYRVLRVFGCVDFASSRMSAVFLSIRNTSRQLTLMANGQSVLTEMITYIVAAVIIVMMPSKDGVINLGVLISYPAAILFIRSEMIVLISGYQQLANTESSIKRLFDIIKTPEQNETEVKPADNVTQIRFNNVTFSYHPEHDGQAILEHANLQLSKGQLHVITGPSGIGKSTTLDLLLGLLQPQQGAIELQKEAPDSTHNGAGGSGGIALVEQEPFFFNGTLYDNLCIGRSDISTADIMGYIAELRLQKLFPTEESLTQHAEQYNRMLSTGEKQRLALIRALLGHPSVLVADEVTSNTDADASRIIIDYLRRLSRSMLVVAVSHDPALISAADVLHQLKDKTFEDSITKQ